MLSLHISGGSNCEGGYGGGGGAPCCNVLGGEEQVTICNKGFVYSLVVGASVPVIVSFLLATSSSTKLEDPKRHSVVSILLFEVEVTEESPSRAFCLQSGLVEQYLSALVCSCADIWVLAQSFWVQESYGGGNGGGHGG